MPQVIDAESFLGAAHVSRETVERFALYESLLRKWQKTINLVAPSTLDAFWGRHVWDSAQLVPYAPATACHWVDLGSGGGFPGLVLAILLRDRPGFRMHLIESDRRKAAFLREVARATEAPATVHALRIEEAGDQRELVGPDVITARAFAPLARLFNLSERLWAPRTQGLFLKGQRVEEELTEARKYWRLTVNVHPSLADPQGVVLDVRDLSRVDS